MDHAEITKTITRDGPWGTGIVPNPYAKQQAEWERRIKFAVERTRITDKIISLFEPRFITPPETSELIESLVTASDSRKVLEIGTYTGFTTLHILRALIGKQGAKFISIDARPGFDTTWWGQWFPMMEFVKGWTPDILTDPRIVDHAPYELVFVDSDHSVEHTQKELEALWTITKAGTIFLFHDVPEWKSPQDRAAHPVRTLLMENVAPGRFHGVIVPTCEQLDCLDVWGPGYPKECNPHLGIFIRR